MNRRADAYADFVDHPRYGRSPRITGLNPVENFSRGICLGWCSSADERVSETAIIANTGRQRITAVPVTHYFDVKRQCRDCGRNFLFFAEEQRYWYETLHFDLASDCVRCVDCRVAQRDTKWLRERYETLLNQEVRSDLEALELAETAMLLIDRKVFGHRCVQRIRSLINSIPIDSRIRKHATFRDVDRRSTSRIQDGG